MPYNCMNKDTEKMGKKNAAKSDVAISLA